MRTAIRRWAPFFRGATLTLTLASPLLGGPGARALAAQGAHADSRWDAERAQARAVPAAPGLGRAAPAGPAP